MSEDLSLPILPQSSSINSGSGKSLTLDLSDSATDSYALIFPPTNDAGFLENDGDGILSWSAGGGGLSEPVSLSQVLKISDGTVTAPALAFASDTNTGIYTSGADKLDISTGGANRLSMTTTENTFSNKVIIPDGDVANPSLTFATGVTGISGSDTNISLSVSGEEQLSINDNAGEFSVLCNASIFGSIISLTDVTTSGSSVLTKDDYKITITGGTSVIIELPLISALYRTSQMFVTANTSANNVTINVSDGSSDIFKPLGSASLTLLPSEVILFMADSDNTWKYFKNYDSRRINYIVDSATNLNVDDTHYAIRVTSTATITLQSSNIIGRELIIINDISSGTLTISPNGANINGSASDITSTTRYDVRKLLYTVGGWILI